MIIRLCFALTAISAPQVIEERTESAARSNANAGEALATDADLEHDPCAAQRRVVSLPGPALG